MLGTHIAMILLLVSITQLTTVAAAGKKCENRICNHEARCRLENNQPVCDCVGAKYFKGKFCKEQVDNCSPNPCKNGAKCTKAIGQPICGPCPGTFSGHLCHVSVPNLFTKMYMHHNRFAFQSMEDKLLFTAESLGNKTFQMELYAKNYAIEVLSVDPKNPKKWHRSSNLYAVAKSLGLSHFDKLPYQKGFYYVASATFWLVGLQKLRFKVSDPDSPAPLLDQDYELHVYKIDELCHPDIELKHCADPFNPLILDVERYNNIPVIIRKRCRKNSNVSYDWNVYTTSESHLLHSYDMTVAPFLKIKPYPSWTHFLGELTQSFMISVRAMEIAEGFADTDYVARCYVFIMPKPVVAIIKGNTERAVDVSDEVIMDGTPSRNYGLPPKKRAHLIYTWSCQSKDDPNNEYCYEKISKGFVLIIPENKFKLGKSYNITLEVQSSNDLLISDKTSQIVTMVSTKPLFVTIECIRNCAMRKFTPNVPLHLKARCLNCDYGTTIKYFWTVNKRYDPENLRNRLIMEKAPQVDVLSVEVAIKYQGRNATALMELKQNQPPAGGRCEIKPGQGEEAVTVFEISCPNYDDLDKPLWYNFACGKFVLDHTTNPTIKTYLSGEGAVKISICDDLQSCTYTSVKASLTPFKKKSTVLTILEDPESSAVDLHRNGETLKAVLLVDIAATIFNGTNEASFISARMRRFQLRTIVDLQRFSNVATILFNKLEPVKHDGMIAVDSFLITLVDGFQHIIDDGEAQAITPLIYESFQISITFMLEALQKVTERPNRVHLLGPTLAHTCHRLDDIFESVVVSDIEVSSRILRWVSTHHNFYKCLYMLGIMASYAHKPEDPSTITQLALTRFESISFDGRKSRHIDTPDGVADIYMEPSTIFELQMILGTKDLLLQLVTFKNDLYWWFPERHRISTGMLQFSAFNIYSKYRILQDIQLSEYFLIKFNLTKLKDTKKNDRYHMLGCLKADNDMNVFHVRVPKNSVLAINFLSSSIDLHVNLSLGAKPSGYFTKYKKYTTVPKGTIDSIYRPLVVLNNDTDDLDAYLAVIAAEKIGKDYAVFSFVPELRECLSWKFQLADPQWTTDDCWPEPTEFLTDGLHCYCKHMSIYSGKIFPTPAFALYGVGNLLSDLSINWYMFGFELGLGLIFIVWVLIAYLCLSPSRERLIVSPKTDGHTIITTESTGEVIIRFTTGGFRNSSTTAGIILVISTIHGNFKYKIYQNPDSPLLKRHSTSTVILPIDPEDLTQPIKISLRHDGGGRYASWYCHHIEIDYKGLSRPVKILTDTWIGEHNAEFVEGQKMKKKQNSKWQKFRNNLEVISTNWFLHNPLIGPWKYGNQTCNRFERTLIFMIKTAIAILIVSFLFGWTMLANYEHERRKYRYINIDISHALILSAISFIIGSAVQLGVEYWMSKFSRGSKNI